MLSEDNAKRFSYVIDKDTFFNIAPKQGTLDRNEVKVFEVMYTPTKVGSFHSVAHMVMHGIPEINKQLMLANANEIHKTSLSKEDMLTTDFVG